MNVLDTVEHMVGESEPEAVEDCVGHEDTEGVSVPEMVILGLPEVLCEPLTVPLTVTLPDTVPQEVAERDTLELEEIVTDCVEQPELVMDGDAVPLTLGLPDGL